MNVTHDDDGQIKGGITVTADSIDHVIHIKRLRGADAYVSIREDGQWIRNTTMSTRKLQNAFDNNEIHLA